MAKICDWTPASTRRCYAIPANEGPGLKVAATRATVAAMRIGPLFLAILFATTVGAATQYRYVRTSTGSRLTPKTSATVRLEGKTYRIDWDEIVTASAEFSTDGGKNVVALHRELATWFHGKAVVPDSTLYSTVTLGKGKVKLKSIALTQEPGSEIAGYATRKYVLRFAYDIRESIGGNPLRTIFQTTAEMWVTDALDGAVVPLDVRSLQTGEDKVDAAVKDALSAVRGFPLQRRLVVTRQYEGGPAQTDVVTSTFSEFTTAELPPSDLAIPEGYRYQEPVISVPGL